MKQFSLKEYLANPSRKLVTRDGRPVRILCTDRKSYNVEIVGLIMNDNGMEFVFTWTQQGRQYINMDTPNDLFFAPKNHEGWVNIYKSKYDGYELLQVYQRKEDAETEKHINDSDVYVTTTKIEWEE